MEQKVAFRLKRVCAIGFWLKQQVKHYIQTTQYDQG